MQKSTSQYNEEGGVGNSPTTFEKFCLVLAFIGIITWFFTQEEKMEKLAEEYDTKADLIDELRTLIDSNEDNKYCDEHQLKEYIKIILKKIG